MQHDWTVLVTVSRYVMKIKSFRQIEIALNGRELPRPANSVFDVNVDFRTVERSICFSNRVVQPVTVQCFL